MNYILSMTASRKNAKRHIVLRGHDIEYLRKVGKGLNEKYTVEIYTGNWEFVEEVER